MTVRLVLDAPEVTLHEPVFGTLFITNGLAEGVSGQLGIPGGKEHIRLDVTLPDGRLVPAWWSPLEMEKKNFGPGGTFELGPSQLHSKRLLLNEWYRFRESGTHVIGVAITEPVLTASGAAVSVSASEPAVLHIAPRDPERLARLCEDLARTASLPFMSSPDAGGLAEHAAIALSFIHDPIAVPFMVDACERADLEIVSQEVVPGLAEIDSPEAIESLFTLASLRTDVGRRARFMLHLLVDRTGDPALKRRVDALFPWHGSSGRS